MAMGFLRHGQTQARPVTGWVKSLLLDPSLVMGQTQPDPQAVDTISSS